MLQETCQGNIMTVISKVSCLTFLILINCKHSKIKLLFSFLDWRQDGNDYKAKVLKKKVANAVRKGKEDLKLTSSF